MHYWTCILNVCKYKYLMHIHLYKNQLFLSVVNRVVKVDNWLLVRSGQGWLNLSPFSDDLFQKGMKFEESFSIQKICVTKTFIKNEFKLISDVGKSQFLVM